MRYEDRKKKMSCWDEGDLVLDLYKRFMKHGHSGILLHQTFIDEVQDFTQAELVLVLKLARFPNSSFLAGDTAQTIARGVGFRFADLKTLFHDMGYKVRDPHKLTHNYRSHTGVLRLASNIVDVIYKGVGYSSILKMPPPPPSAPRPPPSPPAPPAPPPPCPPSPTFSSQHTPDTSLPRSISLSPTAGCSPVPSRNFSW